MDDYVLALRSKDETPGLLLAMTREAEAAILDKYQADVASKQQGIYGKLGQVNLYKRACFTLLYFTEKEHQKQLERARKEQRKAERGELRTEQEQHEESDPAIDTKDIPQQSEQPVAVAAMHNEGVVRAAHSMTHDVSHSEPVRKFTLTIKLTYESSYKIFLLNKFILLLQPLVTKMKKNNILYIFPCYKTCKSR